MKKLTATFADDADIDVQSIIKHAIDFRIETLPNGNTATKLSRFRKSDHSVQSTIMSHFTPNGTFNDHNAKTWVTAKSYSSVSHAAALSRLVKTGYVRRLGVGKYQFLLPFKPDQLKG